MFKELRNHMLLFNMATISLVIVIAFSAIYFVTYNNIKRENERRLQAMSTMPFMPNHPILGGGDEPPFVLERFGADYRVSFVLFVKNGRLENVNSHLDFDDHTYQEAFEKIGPKATGEITLDGKRWAFATSSVVLWREQNRYDRIVFLDITNGMKTLRSLFITLFCVGLATLLVLLWLSYHFAARAVRPIEENYNKQKQFVADASHEFKTPLAIINANIDAIEASANESVASQREWFAYIHAELGRAARLVDNLLYLARAENIDHVQNASFNFSCACETICASMEAKLYDSGISLTTEIKKHVFLHGDGEKITQVVYILLDNAGKYTPPHGRITVKLRLEHKWAVLQVTNTGPGIPAGDLNRIFDRFYRADASRSQKIGGFGLGLSIAKAIIERSGGEISAASNDEITTFTVRFKSVSA